MADLTELKKALDIAAAGDKLVQPLIDKIIQSLILVHNPLRNNIPRKPGTGSEWILNRRTAAATSAWVNDTEEPTESQSTYEQVKFPYKTLLVRGAVTRKLQAVGKTYIDILAEEINSALDVVRDAEEDCIINGDSSVNPKQYDGLRKLIPSEQTIVAGTNGAPLTLKMMDEAIDLCYGKPSLIVCSKRTRRELNALLQAQQRFVEPTFEIKGGFKVISYNDIPILWSQKISDSQTQGTATNASDLFILDLTKVWIGVLTELKMVRLAATTSQKDVFDIVQDTTLVMANPKYHARIQGIIPPS